PPFKVAEFDIMYAEGISRAGEVLDLGVEYDVITKRGSFYSFGEERLGQGRENSKQFLRDNPQLTQQIETQIREAANLRPQPSYDVDGEADDEEIELTDAATDE
ncbi:MAG: DNA recombination/repair protein RecA, partial [Chloroflexota bacterium]